MKKFRIFLVTLFYFFLGNMLVLSILPPILRVFDYNPEQGFLWGDKSQYFIGGWLIGFLLVCIGTIPVVKIQQKLLKPKE